MSNNNLIPNNQRDFISEAAAIGSKATTKKGAIRALIASKKSRAGKPAWKPKFHRISAIRGWELAQRARKSDPEAKAARAGHKRKQYLSALTRRENDILRPPVTMDGMIAAIDGRQRAKMDLTEIARLRAIVTGKKQEPKKLNIKDYAIKINGWTAAFARKHKAEIRMTGKNWELYSSLSRSHIDHTPGETIWKNGRPKSYTRATCDNYVRSFAVMWSSTTIDGIFHATRYSVTLPDGYAWGKDANGLKAYDTTSTRDDYHPEVSDLLADDAADLIIKKIIENRETRRAMEARAIAEKAAMEGVWVCLADSIRAGNCKSGTIAFCNRHALDPSRHYTAQEIFNIANGDASWARLAITAATLRHQREMRQGYSELSDHIYQ